MTQGWQTLAFSPNPASVIDALASTGVTAPVVINTGVATPSGFDKSEAQ